MNQREANISKGIDTGIVWLYVALVCIGLIAIFSVEYRSGDPFLKSILDFKKNYSKQFLFFGVSSIVAVFILLTDSKFFTATANLLYLFGILLMLLTFVIGKDISGSKSWIALGGGFNLQPAELCKVFTSLALAKYMSRPETEFRNFRAHFIAFSITLLPAILSIAQKELGLALVYLSFFLVMYREGLPSNYLITGFSTVAMFVAAIVVDPDVLAILLTIAAIITTYLMRRAIKKKKSIVLLIAAVCLLCIGIQRVALPFVFDKMFKPYQVERILGMFGKEYEPRDPVRKVALEKEMQAGKKKDRNYNVKQSKIAIGSGGLTGKGFLKGITTQGDFVPEQHTDFIFTAIAESFGSWGSLLLLSLYFLLLMRSITIAERQRSVFSRVYAYSVAAILFFHVFINICMTIGLMPVIGITLPLLSYGGSSLITFTILIFIMVRLDADRQMVLR